MEVLRVRSRIVVAVACLSALVAACSSYQATDNPTERTAPDKSTAALSFASGNNDGYCASNSSAQCFEGTPIKPKQLVLTFDDGPGSRTLELSSYLRSQGIRATFFVNGHCFGASALDNGQCQQDSSASPSDLLSQVVADGHLIGNHTQDHFDLTSLDDATILRELTDTDAIISPFVASGHFVFRAPYGSWSSHDYDVLQASAMSKYVGPVKWDIGGAMTSSGYAADWDCWQNTNGYGVMTTKQCGDRYLQEIGDVGRGIILMHDADYGDVSNHDLTSGKGNTIDMVKYLIEGSAAFNVTGLVGRGYTFLRSDEVPDIAAALGSSGGGGGTDAGGGGSDAGGGGGDAGSGTCAFNPTWQQTTSANDWWVEFTISGSIASASVEVVGGSTFALSSEWGKWVGSTPSQIPSGTQIVVHAKSTTGQSAQTRSFPYLVTTKPVTACVSSAPDAGSPDAGSPDAGSPDAGSSDAGSSDAGSSDAGSCSSAFNPAWSEGEANNWWVEYAISGSVASAYLEVVGSTTIPLSSQWGKWVGPTNRNIATGTTVIVHAKSTTGLTAQTKPFAYLTVTNPLTAPCAN